LVRSAADKKLIDSLWSSLITHFNSNTFLQSAGACSNNKAQVPVTSHH